MQIKILKLKKYLSFIFWRLLINLIYINPFYLKIKIPHTDALKLLHDTINEKIINYKINFLPITYDLTIILPIYNSEKYIENCLKSILSQKTRYNFEVIAINDGSSDRSDEICRKIKNKHVKYFTINNSGAANSRNFGLAKSSGQYIMFVDADDILLPDAIESLMNEIILTKVSIVQGNFYYYNEKNDQLTCNFNINENELFDLHIDKSIILRLDGYPWAKVYKRELFDDLSFPDFAFEDTLIWLTIYNRADKISIISKPVYKYIIQDNSETKRLTSNIKCIDTFYIVPYLIEMNKKLQIQFNETFYIQILRQFSKLMFVRCKGLNDILLSALLVVSKQVLVDNEVYSPKRLNKIDKLYKKAILGLNFKLYKTISKYY